MSSRSGNKGVVINTGERAVSTDINRAQAMLSGFVMEAMRWLLNVNHSTDDVQAGGYALETLTGTTPPSTEILGGLIVLPDVGTLNIAISDGLGFEVDPDATPSADDSVYKYVRSQGVAIGSTTPTGTTLAMSGNSSGSARIDVIECQRIDDPSPETSSRDIFNTITNLFTASTVQKSVGSVFDFRVRTNCMSGGNLTIVAGWTPLCVASVPNGTTTNDTITFWDVRPLVSDRIFGVSNQTIELPRRTMLMHSSNNNGASAHQLAGVVECDLVSRRIGGQLRRGSPGVDYLQPYIDFSDAANQEAGMTLTGASPALLFYYLAVPFGLPHWARYTDAAAGAPRVPRSPRGIPIASKVKPNHVFGVPQSAITLPTVFGFTGGSTTKAVCFGATTYNGGVINNQTTSDGWTSLASPVAGVNPAVYTPNITSPTTITFEPVENTHFPACAKRLRLKLLFSLAPSFAPGVILPTLTFGTTPTQQVATYHLPDQPLLGPTANDSPQWIVEVEVPNLYPATPANSIYTASLAIGYALPTGWNASPDPTLQVVGWKM